MPPTTKSWGVYLNAAQVRQGCLAASPKVPPGFPPPLPAGAKLPQKRECSTCPPMLNESSFKVAFMSRSVPSFLDFSSF